MSGTSSQAEKFQLFFTLTKVDEAKRLVYGRATEEVPDGVREIIDVQKSIPYFKKWSEGAQKRAAQVGKVSLGNVREMHEPIAAGKVIDIDYGDKAIDVGTFCSNDSTWKKILDGTLTGFSVGGRYVDRFPDSDNPSLTRYIAEPHEISYVDSPAVPTATFKLIKSDGTEELRKAISLAHAAHEDVNDREFNVVVGGMQYTKIKGSDLWLPKDVVAKQAVTIGPVQPGVDTNPADDDPMGNKVENKSVPDVDKIISGQEVKDVSDVAGILSPDVINPNRAVAPAKVMNDPIAKDQLDLMHEFVSAVGKLEQIMKVTDDEKKQKEDKLKALGSRVGINRRDGEPLTPPKDYPSDPNEYGDPANHKYPVDSSRASTAVGYFNAGGGKDKYSPREWNLLGRRITRLASRFGVKYKFDPKKQEIERTGEKMEKLDVNNLVRQLAAAHGIAADQIADDPNAVKDLLMQVVGAMDTRDSQVSSATPGGGATPPTPPSGGQQDYAVSTLKAQSTAVGSPASTSSGDDTTTGSSSPSTQQTQLVGADMPKTAATPPTPPTTAPTSSSSSSSPSTPETKTMADQIADLQKQNKEIMDVVHTFMAALAKGAEASTSEPVVHRIVPSIPVNDLAANLMLQASEENVVIKALISEGRETPDKFALAKAAELAGTKDHPDVDSVMNLAQNQAFEDLTKSMAFSQYYTHGGIFGTYAPPEPPAEPAK